MVQILASWHLPVRSYECRKIHTLAHSLADLQFLHVEVHAVVVVTVRAAATETRQEVDAGTPLVGNTLLPIAPGNGI